MAFGTNITGGNYNASNELMTYDKESLLTFTEDYAGAQAAAVILTPTAGKKIEITGIYVSSDGALTDVTLDFSGGTHIFKLYTTNFTTGAVSNVHIEGGTNETVKLTCGADTFISFTYYESD